MIAEFKEYVPEYVRIMRVQRDIPSMMVESGVDKTNLRQYIERLKPNCRCIRCREAGRKTLINTHPTMNKQFNKTNKSSQSNKSNQLELITKKYQASQGTEYFISYEFR